MKLTYILRVQTDELSSKEISQIVEKESHWLEDEEWACEIVKTDADSNIDFVNEFLQILEGKYQILYQRGLGKTDISFWVYYEYDNECKLDFSSLELKRMGENGIILCITCWEKGGMIFIPDEQEGYIQRSIKYTYTLEISTNQLSSRRISEILHKQSHKSEVENWAYEIVQTELEPYVDFIDEALKILEGKYIILNQYGVKKNDILIKVNYDYDNQCNLEFWPLTMKRLGENGISLHISCEQIG